MQVHSVNDGPVTLWLDSALDSAFGASTRSAPRG
jgi:hypothetical protein